MPSHATHSPSTPDLHPPKGVRDACKRGLELQPEHGGKGLVEETLTWAHAFVDGKPATPEKLRKMRAWFARHEVDHKVGWDDPPTPGFVAWLLWGGDAGKSWSQSVVPKLDA